MRLIEIFFFVQLSIAGVFGISTNVSIDGLGTVIGLQEYTKFTNRTIFSFRGIPYAEPPVGDLRFRPPVSLTWNGTRDATEHGYICPQSGATLSYSEDCLTLNVYVPQTDDQNAVLPVMIWIHGGTFTAGNAQRYQPHYLLEEDVILVVIQFRLGPLGLLCLQTDEIPGNVQFLDQIMAMQWVQDHIASFGGDPDQVTLFGQSSGGATVNFHQFSPLSRGLFHRAIIQSGSAFAPWVMDYNPVQTATRLGNVVNCTSTNITELATCFKGLDVQTLIDGFDIYLAQYSFAGLTEIGGNRAVIQTAGTQIFLSEDPATLLASSNYIQVPMMGGATKHDGSYALASYYEYFVNYGIINNTEFLQYNFLPFVISTLGLSDIDGAISQTLANVHFEVDQIGNFTEMIPGIIDICSVFVFKAGIFKMLQANSRVNETYLYRFGYFGEYRSLEASGVLPFKTGVGHSDELYYLFPFFDLSDDDVIIAKRMTSLWTSFAITGQPKTDDKNWEPMSAPFGPYLIIDEEFFDGTNYLSEHTIALQEGMTAVDRSSSAHVTPKSLIIIGISLWSILKT